MGQNYWKIMAKDSKGRLMRENEDALYVMKNERFKSRKGILVICTRMPSIVWRRTRDSNSQAIAGNGFQDRRITIILVLREGRKIIL
jgi:hypothetical protein